MSGAVASGYSERPRNISRSGFREFVLREIVPGAATFDREERVPASLVESLAREGYLGAAVSSSNGGSGMSMETLGVLHEEIGRGCSSVRSLLTVHSMVSYAVQTCGNKRQRDLWLSKLAMGNPVAAFGLTEPNAGSDAGAMETQAIRKGSSFVLNGVKKWTTFGQTAGLYLIFAKCEGQITAFLVERDRPGLAVVPITGMLGTRASMLAELRLQDCEIPKENLVGAVGFGMAMVGSVALDLGRYSVACGCVGIAQACLDASLEHARIRKQFGSPLKDHQLVARLLSRMVVNVKAARLLCERAGKLKGAGEPSTVFETLIAKYFASTTAMQAASDAVQIHGASGCAMDSDVQRYFRDAKVMEIIEGSTQMQEIMIAQQAYTAPREDL